MHQGLGGLVHGHGRGSDAIRVLSVRIRGRIVVIAVACSLVAAACSTGSDHKSGNAAARLATAAGPGLHGPVSAAIDERAHVGIAHLVPATKVWRLTSESPVDGRVTVRLPLLRRPRQSEVVVGLTAKRRSGPWTPLAASIDPDGRFVLLATTHFSWFSGLFADVGDAIREAKRNIVDGLTSDNFAEAVPPRCAGEDQARTGGYTISSDSKDTVYWCFGVEGGRRILRVVDRRRYPLSVSHSGLTTITQGHWNGLATLSRIASGERAVIAPREAITFRVDAVNGSRAVLHTELDGFGQSLYQLQIGVQTALDLMTAFGFKSATTAVYASAHLAGIADCATALENPADAGALLTKCLSVKNIIETFGIRALLIAPIMVASGLIEFFRSELNALGDQLNRRDEYTIRITTTRSPTATSPQLEPDGLGVAQFGDDSEKTIAALTAVLGPPDHKSRWVEQYCGTSEGGGGQIVAWGDLTVLLNDSSRSMAGGKETVGRHFWEYEYGVPIWDDTVDRTIPFARKLGLRTSAGIGLGSTVADVTSAYDYRGEFYTGLGDSYGISFPSGGGFNFWLSATSPNSKVVAIDAGPGGCGE
jgi:hypothetical protein